MLWKGLYFTLTTNLRKRLKVSLPQAHSVLSPKLISSVSHSRTWRSLESWLNGSSSLPGSHFCFNGGLGYHYPRSFSNWGCVTELQAGSWVTERSSLLPPFLPLLSFQRISNWKLPLQEALCYAWASQVALVVKNLPTNAGDDIRGVG